MYMAISVDGVTARYNGDEDFLSPKNWDRFVELAEESGAFVVGRATYEAVKKWDNHSYSDADAERIVLTSSEKFEVEDEYHIAHSTQEAIDLADDADAVSLLVTGGALTNTSFFQEELVDRLYLNVEPTIVGSGVNLIDEKIDVDLSFVRMSRTDDILHLEYTISS